MKNHDHKKSKPQQDQHRQHEDQKNAAHDHTAHHRMMIRDFRRRFYVTLVLTLPVLAVVRSADGTAVFRVRDGHAQRLPVTVLQLAGEQVLVRGDDIAAGDLVVYAGLSRLVDGDRVEILP